MCIFELGIGLKMIAYLCHLMPTDVAPQPHLQLEFPFMILPVSASIIVKVYSSSQPPLFSN